MTEVAMTPNPGTPKADFAGVLKELDAAGDDATLTTVFVDRKPDSAKLKKWLRDRRYPSQRAIAFACLDLALRITSGPRVSCYTCSQLLTRGNWRVMAALIVKGADARRAVAVSFCPTCLAKAGNLDGLSAAMTPQLEHDLGAAALERTPLQGRA